MVHRARLMLCAAAVAAPVCAVRADSVFVEAEAFSCSSDGWRENRNPQARKASRATTLHGASGAGDAVATGPVALEQEGRYRIFVRYLYHDKWRGPFRVAVEYDGRELAAETFDLAADAGTAPWEYVWRSFEAQLPAGEVALRLTKHDRKNCVGYVRHVDCFLLTSDPELVPNHVDYGPQTYLRVTVGDGYEKPVQIHVFADHYRAPWYAHYHLSRGGVAVGLAPSPELLLGSGDSTPWCNITPMLYQDSGAILNLTARYTYHDWADHLQATFELATAPSADAVVRTIRADCRPNGLVIVAPPDLTTPENLSRLRTDRDVAEATGRVADAFRWPTHGRRPQRFPFLAATRVGGYGTPVDEAVRLREEKTLSYFGFTPAADRVLHGLWYMKNGSYCQPDLEKMRRVAAERAADFREHGGAVGDILYCMLMDEPGGQPASFLARDPAYADAFRAWLRTLGKTPEDLLVADWDAVRPVAPAERDRFPALNYFTQRFRTRALSEFMRVQRQILEEAHGGPLLAAANFSDGAIYSGNFYTQGVDYFELLDSDGQNALWSEDWANLASTYQCAAYNVELMRAAARERDQVLGHYLISYAGRKPWDIKLKATSSVARGVKILKSFFYGPSWGSHEGGPLWRSTAWYSKPETWPAHAEIVREVGAAEDLLFTAMPAPARVAILYSSSTDVWTLNGNHAYGFDRMHTWLALAHAQIPVDIVSEQQVERGVLDGYRVCYLSGPNLTRPAAERLCRWVGEGGTLWLASGAAQKDEYNRPLRSVDELMPATRGEVQELQAFLHGGRSLHTLKAQDQVRWGEAIAVEALSVKQALTLRPGTELLATFEDGSPAVVFGSSGQGRVFCLGFLPALAYIKAAETARNELQARVDAAGRNGAALSPGDSAQAALLERSYNPWSFPAGIRDLILTPVRAAGVDAPLRCSVPLVDAVFMACEQGVLIPLANYTLRAIESLELEVAVPRPVTRVESVRHGPLQFAQADRGRVTVRLSLDCNDFVKLIF